MQNRAEANELSMQKGIIDKARAKIEKEEAEKEQLR